MEQGCRGCWGSVRQSRYGYYSCASWRELARADPEVLASSKLGAELLLVVAELAGLDAGSVRLGRWWEAIAELGGYQPRKGRQAGWQTLWRGWQYVQTILEGVNLARRLPP